MGECDLLLGPKLLRTIAPGDVLIVTRLDRLARSTRDLLNVLDSVAKAGASGH
jgi:DNA invertase Pin-like site-specific DNA recombinase